MKPAKATPSTALIVGGGVVGFALAFQLRSLGVDTLLIDAAEWPPPASWGNAGHIATEQVAPLASRAIIAGIPRRGAGAGPRAVRARTILKVLVERVSIRPA